MHDGGRRLNAYLPFNALYAGRSMRHRADKPSNVKQ